LTRSPPGGLAFANNLVCRLASLSSNTEVKTRPALSTLASPTTERQRLWRASHPQNRSKLRHEYPAIPDGIIAEPSEPQFSSNQDVI
jgi:hypothetical protein